MASFAEWTEQQKKKKKKEELTAAEQSASGKSFTDYTKQVLGRDDIEAPLSKKDDDIAPVVTTTEKEDDRKWFQKGLFEDGWQFGDITKTILGTIGDVAGDLGTGIIGMGEKAVDAGMTLGALMNRSTMNQAAENEMIFNTLTGKDATGVLDKYQKAQEEVEKETAKFVAKDLYDEEEVSKQLLSNVTSALYLSNINQSGGFATQADWDVANQMREDSRKYIDEDMEKQSVLGDKSDSLVQSAGQLGATMALQAVGVPWWLTTGTTTFGSEAEQAFKEDATFNEAVFSSAVTAGAEILTERISGGISFGGKTLDNALTKELGRAISNKTARTLVKLGVDATGEGFEEILSGALSAVGQKMSYAKEKDFNELFSSEEAFESFIGGAVLGGGSSVVNAVKAKADGVDAVTGFTDNEQKVVDKEYQDRIAEAEKNGKVTQSEKSKIYDAVLKDFEKGYISTDTIEEVLGGKTYKAYKDTIDNEMSLQKEYDTLKAEYDTLNAMKRGDMTGVQQDRQAELKQQMDELKAQMENEDAIASRDQLKSQLSDEVFNLTKDSRLVESYNERARRGMAYEADLSKYDAKQQKVIQKAVDSGILNNTNRTHEFVDMVAKISADKGVLFDFTNNEKLKESGFAINGAQVNGYVTKDGVTVNINSAKSLNSVVGHEITHILEGTELYTELQNVLFAYAKSKGEYDSRLEGITALYKKYAPDADPKAELTADLVGDYLFTDSDFISRLSVEHRNVFQKIYDEVKYLLKVATAGSAEARELEKVKRAFDKAYKESGTAQKNTATEGGVVYSLGQNIVDQNGTKYDNVVQLEYDTFNKVRRSGKAYIDFVRNNLIKQKTTVYDAEGNPEVVEFAGEKERVKKDGAKNSHPVIGELTQAKNELKKLVILNATETAEISNFAKHKDEHSHQWLDENGWDERTSYVMTKDGTIYPVTLHIAKTRDGRNILYDVNVKTKEGVAVDENATSLLAKQLTKQAVKTTKPSNDILPQNSEKSSGNNKQTADANVLFSLSKSVEESGNLMALHNLTTEKLLKSLELGGLPMPSIAITKDSIPHDNFGDITLIFGKDTVDPKANKKNVAYSADAWTPTFPRVEYEADSSVARRVNNKLSELAEKVDDTFRRDLDMLKYSHEDNLNFYGGEDGLIKHAMDKYGLKAAFLEEQGQHIDKVTKQVEVDKGFNSANEAKYQAIADILGVSTAEEIGKMPLNEAKEAHGEALEAIYPGMTKTAMRMSGVFKQVMSYLTNTNSEPTYKTVTDESAMRQAVDDAINEAEFEAWTRKLFDGIVKDSGVYNQKDLFTPSGNRRSFKQTHLPVTLENIVKAMAAQNNGNTKNVSGFNGIKTLRAATAEQFKSIKAMHDSEGRLQHLTQEEADKLNDELSSRLYNILETVDAENGNKGESNPYIRLDTIGEILTEIGEGGKYNVADIQQVFEQYRRPISDDTAADIKQLLYDVTQMPVNIFEAKPERAVSFDEAGVFVIPYNADAKLKQELLNRGYAIAEYDPDVEGDRQKVVNQFEEYKFSLSTQGETPKTYGNYNVRGEDIALETEQEVAPVQETEDVAPVQAPVTTPKDEADELISAIIDEEFRLQGYEPDAEAIAPTTEAEANAQAQRNLRAIDDADIPTEAEAPYQGDYPSVTADDPFSSRNWHERGTKAFITENPDVKPFFQEEARRLADDYAYTMPAERGFSDEQYYNTNGEKGFYGWSRKAADDINTLIDVYGLSYAQIEEGLDAIINDTDKVNNKPAKTIEFILNDRMLKGYETYYSHEYVAPNQGYIEWLNGQRQAEEYSEIANTITDADAPMVDDVAPVIGNAPSSALYNKRQGENGWGDVYSTADEALNDAVQMVNKELWDAYIEEVDNAIENLPSPLPPDSMPIDDARSKVIDAVRRETVTPIQGAQILSEAYNLGGVDALKKLRYLNADKLHQQWQALAKQISNAPIAENIAPVMKSGTSPLMEIANNGRRDNLKGAYTQDGKQYIADGSFIAEFNTVDENLAAANDFPAKKVLAELNEADARQTEGNYSIDGEAVAALNNGTRNFIKVGDSLFDAKYVDAIMSAIDSPVFTMSNVLGGDNALFVVGSNGRAVLMPVRAGDNVRVSYEAQPMTDLTAEDVMPIAEDIAPVKYEAIKPQPKEKEPRMVRADNAKSPTTAKVLTAEPKVEKKKRGVWSMAKELVFDNGMVFEDIAKKTKNRSLEAKWNFIRYAENNAQHFIKEGANGVKSLDAIREQVEKTGKTEYFYNYLYHNLNVDRMTLENRYKDAKNKPVFGDTVTADRSRQSIKELEKDNPEFKRYAKDVYDYMNHLRSMMVENGVISQETADLWAEMYPHYVPIRRVGDSGLNINVPLDTGITGVNAPVKGATGGSRDILPLFDTMGQRTLQTFKAVAKNSFGVELKNALGTAIESDAASVDDVIDSVDTHEELLQEGKNGRKPTFTVFEGGEKVTFEITDEMYDAMKPTSNALAYTNKVLNKANDIRRGLLTEYNPTFLFTNAIKDMQDVLINSQHPAKTYSKMPQAISELKTKGKWYAEYMANGGEQNSYFDNDTNTFKEENATMEALKKLTGLGAISNANNFIERIPRLAEYIASREAGASVEVAMLDAARVTTNFAAGGKLTKMLNRNGFTFLNASMQGAVQQVRNIREAKMKGLKGWAGLAAKFAVAGLASSLLNHLLWDDDEEYEELSDYVKDNYYIVAKYGDGQFVRIPKGRAVAVIQNAFEQMENAITGDDEVDLGRFTELVVSNLAPNNPLDNNLLAPVMQAASNKTWYGDDLVPTRLQDVPAAEQYDETTDSISKWLGEKTGTSPYKWNYLLDQYSGGVGDTFLPMLTPAAERGDPTGVGNLLAPFKDKFTTDSVLKNQNVSDFYDTVDELAVNANASGATEEDVLKYKYINSINAELSDLYKQKREVQNGDLPDDEKYEAVRELQQQIVDIAKEGLNTYNNVNIVGEYASVGDREYRWYEPSEGSDAEAGWQKITDKQAEKQDVVTSALGISKAEYWRNKEEYDYAYEYPDKYAVAKAVGGYTAYKGYSSELYDIKADKDEDGKSISGSRKEKVIEYINNLDADYGERIILYKSEYNADDTYNYDIIEYLNSRDDISYDEMATILKELGFTVTADGSIYW